MPDVSKKKTVKFDADTIDKSDDFDHLMKTRGDMSR